MPSPVARIVRILIAVAVPAAVTVGQEAVKPVTVCEVLAHPKKFINNPVAVVGRLDCKGSLIDHTCYLVEDRCDKPFVSHGRTWPNQISIQDIRPLSPKSNIEISESVLKARIAALRRSTTLATHQTQCFKHESDVSTAPLVFDRMCDMPDEWGIAYGRIFTSKDFQHFTGAGIGLRINLKDLRPIKADEYRQP